MDTTTVLYLVGAALWTLATRHRPGLHVVSVVTVPDCRPVSAVPHHVGAALWPLAIHRRSALDAVSVVIA